LKKKNKEKKRGVEDPTKELSRENTKNRLENAKERRDI
jgi:hypothetical protein